MKLDELTSRARELYADGTSLTEVEEFLVVNGLSRYDAARLTSTLSVDKSGKRRKRGFLCLAIGGFFLVLGFIITVLLYHSGMPIGIAMYGPTSVGAVLLLAGLVMLFT